LREIVLRLLTRPPVNQFLKISHFQETPLKQILLTYVEPHHFAPPNKVNEFEAEFTPAI